MNNIVEEMSKQLLISRDKWFVEVITKHCSLDYEGKALTNFDIMFLRDQFKLEVNFEGNRTNVEVDGELVGYWEVKNTIINNEKEFSVKTTTNQWIK